MNLEARSVYTVDPSIVPTNPKPERIKIPGKGRLDVVRFSPEHHNPNQPPIILIGGWGTTTRTYRYTAEALKKEGYDVAIVKYRPKLTLPFPFQRQRERNELLDEAHAIGDFAQHLVQESPLKEVDIIGHSRGAMVATKVIEDIAQRPKHSESVKVREAVFVNPAAFTSHETLFRLGPAFLRDRKEQKSRSKLVGEKHFPPTISVRLRKSLQERRNFLLKIPTLIRQTLQLSILPNQPNYQQDMEKSIAQAGVRAHILYGGDDGVFPAGKIENSHFPSNTVAHMTHNGFIGNPEAYLPSIKGYLGDPRLMVHQAKTEVTEQ